ncbi:MAG: magnesium/cobalt transporter CorA [Thiohalobacterales bacterium]|nr:magnesium/cobalt transporter CorA [Thiohalobacterales bacterium]
MIRALLHDTASDKTVSGGIELHEKWLQMPDSVLWLDIADEQQESETTLLRDRLGLHALAISDAQRKRHPPKLEPYDDIIFILLKALSADAEGLQFSTIQLAMFIGDRLLVTRHNGSSPETDRLFRQADGDYALFRKGPIGLALRLSRLLADRYLRVLLDVEPRLEEIEDEILQKPDDELLVELMNYKTELKKFRRLFLYQQQIFHELRTGKLPVITGEIEHEIIDVYEHLERVSSLANLYHEIASDLADGYISLASHNLNRIMKILTIIMSIFVPLSFLAGIYGMNFEYMPELKSQSGYFILLGIMGSIVLILVTIFRRMRWL